MKLYQVAIDLIADINQIKISIEAIEQGIKDDSARVRGRLLLRTADDLLGSYKYAKVRPATYITFLNGELKDLQKDLKVIESQIKKSIG
jgi:hypothetical protein